MKSQQQQQQQMSQPRACYAVPVPLELARLAQERETGTREVGRRAPQTPVLKQLVYLTRERASWRTTRQLEPLGRGPARRIVHESERLSTVSR